MMFFGLIFYFFLGNSSSRLTESRSLNELNRTAEINRQTAEEILNKYKGRLPSSQYILKSIATHKVNTRNIGCRI